MFNERSVPMAQATKWFGNRPRFLGGKAGFLDNIRDIYKEIF